MTPSKASWALVKFATLVLSVASCNAVLGIDQYGPGPDDEGGMEGSSREQLDSGLKKDGSEERTDASPKDGTARNGDAIDQGDSVDLGEGGDDSTTSDDGAGRGDDSTASDDGTGRGDDSTASTADVTTIPMEATVRDSTTSDVAADVLAKDSPAADAPADTVPPRPISPLSTARVTSQKPTLKWALPNGVADATVDLCSDRACTKPIGTSHHVTGSSYAVAAALSPGVVFWRLHPGTVTSVTSPTWEFTVGHRSAAVDTSWGTTLDVNGDGFADLAVGAGGATTSAGPYTGRVYVYLGSAIGTTVTAATILTGPDGTNGQFGFSVASAGDVNGDGYADLVVGAPEVGSSEGRVYVYLGGASGLATTAATILTGTDGSGGEFGYSVTGAGDVNGDGYADVAIGAYGASTYAGKVYVFLGSATGLADTSATTLSGPGGANGFFGFSVASAGDVNGDGYSDLVVGADGVATETGAAYVYRGSVTGLGTTPTTLVSSGGTFGSSVASAGDVNGDGYADVVVGAFQLSNDVGGASIYSGSATGIAATPVITLSGMDGMNGDFGISVAGAGDVNGDGYADVIVGSAGAMNAVGNAYVFSGSATGIVAASFQTVVNTYIPGGQFGDPVAGAGDVNGDGYSDIIVSAAGASNSTGEVSVFLGGNSGGAGEPAANALVGPDGVNGAFGYSVFGASN